MIDVSSKFSVAAPCPKKPDAQGSKGKFMHSKTKKLNSVMKTELMKDKNFEEIKKVLPFLWIYFMLKFNSSYFRYGMNTSKIKLQCQGY